MHGVFPSHAVSMLGDTSPMYGVSPAVSTFGGTSSTAGATADRGDGLFCAQIRHCLALLDLPLELEAFVYRHCKSTGVAEGHEQLVELLEPYAKDRVLLIALCNVVKEAAETAYAPELEGSNIPSRVERWLVRSSQAANQLPWLQLALINELSKKFVWARTLRTLYKLDN